jgi:hypothetical protein
MLFMYQLNGEPVTAGAAIPPMAPVKVWRSPATVRAAVALARLAEATEDEYEAALELYELAMVVAADRHELIWVPQHGDLSETEDAVVQVVAWA